MPEHRGRFGTTLYLTAAQRAALSPLSGEWCCDPDTQVLYRGSSGTWVALDASAIPFSAETPENWPDDESLPGTVSEALNQLAGAGSNGVHYEEINVSTSSISEPYLIAFPAGYDALVIVVTANSISGGYVRLPAPALGKSIQVWNAASLGLLTVQHEGGALLNTINPPSGGAVYTCVGTAIYQWRKVGGDGSEYIQRTGFTGKGKLLVGTGSGSYTALSPGSDGQVLVADSTTSEGVKWTAPSGGGGGGLDGWDSMPADATTTSSVHSIDPGNGLHQRILLAHNLTSITLTEPTAAASNSFLLTIDFVQGVGAGLNAFTLPTAEASWSNCEFPGATVPPISTGNGVVTKFQFQWNGRRGQYELINVVFAL